MSAIHYEWGGRTASFRLSKMVRRPRREAKDKAQCFSTVNKANRGSGSGLTCRICDTVWKSYVHTAQSGFRKSQPRWTTLNWIKPFMCSKVAICRWPRVESFLKEFFHTMMFPVSNSPFQYRRSISPILFNPSHKGNFFIHNFGIYV